MSDKCTVCDSEFSLDEEGGIAGYFGIIPVTFCPWCYSSMVDMVQQMTHLDEENNV